MISPIYKIRNRGQVVNEACQLMGENMKLTFRVIVLPILVASFVLAINILMSENYIVDALVVLFAILVYPVLPNFFFHVIENPEEFDYPNKMPKIYPLMRHWWTYYKPFLRISVTGCLLGFLGSITIFIPFVLAAVLPLTIVICQRDEDQGFQSFITTFKYISNSFLNYVISLVGSCIVAGSLVFSPFALVYGIGGFFRLFLSKSVYRAIERFFNGDSFFNVALALAFLGGAFAVQIIFVIVHFFYGHVKEKTEHVALIEKIDKFDEK